MTNKTLTGDKPESDERLDKPSVTIDLDELLWCHHTFTLDDGQGREIFIDKIISNC